VEGEGDAGALLEVLGEPLDRGDESEVVERARTQLDREPPDVLKRRDDELTDRGNRRAALLRRNGGLQRLQAEQDGRQRLARLVVQLPGEAGTRTLLRRPHTSHARTAHAVRAPDRRRPPRRRPP